jgi:hypothetical protein
LNGSNPVAESIEKRRDQRTLLTFGELLEKFTDLILQQSRVN